MKKLDDHIITKQRTSLLKGSFSEGKSSGSLFTYKVYKSLPSLTVRQQETGFSIDLEIEKLERTLRVTRFKLTDQQQLAYASEDLYDAAALEIMLQTLIYLFNEANRHKLDEILFILPEDDCIHKIHCFEDLFTVVTPLSFGDKKCLALTLSCVLQEFFLTRVTNIIGQIKQELWKAQWSDFYLRNYLQNHPKGEPLFAVETVEPKAAQEDNIILLTKFRDKNG